MNICFSLFFIVHQLAHSAYKPCLGNYVLTEGVCLAVWGLKDPYISLSYLPCGFGSAMLWGKNR